MNCLKRVTYGFIMRECLGVQTTVSRAIDQKYDTFNMKCQRLLNFGIICQLSTIHLFSKTYIPCF